MTMLLSRRPITANIARAKACFSVLALSLVACTTSRVSLPEPQTSQIIPSSGPSISTDVAKMLAGEFDSEKQMLDDKIRNVPEKMRHGWINRSFLRVDAPAVGDPVLVGSTAYGVDPWYFDKDEFLVWTFSEAADGNSVVMSPLRFTDIDRRLPFARDGDKLGNFTSDDLEKAQSGANCEIVWTRTELGFSGRSKPCYVMSTTKNKMLNWRWEYELTPSALWISFAGVDENGDVLDGTPSGKPYRLDRIK